MTQCRKVRSVKRQICIGAMDKLITLKGRDITPPKDNSVDYTQTFDSGALEWSDVKTLPRGPIMFDRTNTARQVTHIFQLRYRDDITAQTWVEYENVNYDVISVEDLEERHEFLFLYAVKRGNKTLPVNEY